MAEQVPTQEQAQHLLAKVFGPNRKFRMIETRHGWVGRGILTEEEQSQGMGLGLGNYVLNKHTGVITAHRSLPPQLIGEEFDQAIETGGQVQGSQVWPPQHRIHLQKAFEDEATVHYQVTVIQLDQPDDPGTTQLVTINKETLYFQPSGGPLSDATAWAEMLSRTTGSWPTEGAIER
ncbi:hypothetical protein [Nocardia rhizosphaerihabitans]|uniref:Uncharacterized protein n=1 Tax=Nocardia rhizosphaerihabitans TaxID=1691570 RepID=A0ABQ2KJX5_9NOCA|nr:hypothetical protein [Nocardia rhizosphaerihabitans]GGN85624.1 hypothetical protein GCM10011610_40170 [Nocardia rhizosphaerihabitans]